MKTIQPILITSVTAGVDLSTATNLFIGFNGSLCANGAKPLGVLNASTNIGEQAPVIAKGIAMVLSGAAVSAGAKVQSDATGKAITYAAGEVAGFSLDAASGAGELIRVLLS
ncbi:MAG TPA: DUF2190 family protein [Ignavibacteriaceae bacterium]|nr:DUF2190 family protein [Ignavibacteriaceae bacterium]